MMGGSPLPHTVKDLLGGRGSPLPHMLEEVSHGVPSASHHWGSVRDPTELLQLRLGDSGCTQACTASVFHHSLW